MEVIDESLYSRQLLVLGAHAMRSMMRARVLLSGLGGLGVEIAKNVILGGVRSFTCHDTAVCREGELNFFVAPTDVGRNRAEVSCGLLAELNPNVELAWSSEPLTAASLDTLLAPFALVILTEAPLELCVAVDAWCRAHEVKFIAAQVQGVFSWSFVDVGPKHEVHDVNGEAVAEIKILSVEAAAAEGGALVKTLESEPHDLQEGDAVSIGGGQARVLKVVKSDQFVVDKIPGAAREFVKVKQVVTVQHASLAESLAGKPKLVGSDFAKSASAGSLFVAQLAVEQFRHLHGGAFPRPWNAEDANAVVLLAKGRLPLTVEDSLFGELAVAELDEPLVRAVAQTSAGCLHPLCAFLGGSVAQEAQKALSGKFMPQNQWALFDAREVLASQSPAFDPDSFRAGKPSHSEALRICCGDSVVQQLASTSLFMIGVGAIGCELMKNFAMLGLASASGGSAAVRITDPDLIEKSNLNRQFLFRPGDISRPKSETAARVIARMNPDMRVVAALDKVCPESETKYSDAFFEEIDVVVNALDNVQARQYVDSRCVALGKPLLESGTLGTKVSCSFLRF
jgi:molybdopterin/thiamine biosynthesis adenylyltransferase